MIYTTIINDQEIQLRTNLRIIYSKEYVSVKKCNNTFQTIIYGNFTDLLKDIDNTIFLSLRLIGKIKPTHSCHRVEDHFFKIDNGSNKFIDEFTIKNIRISIWNSYTFEHYFKFDIATKNNIISGDTKRSIVFDNTTCQQFSKNKYCALALIIEMLHSTEKETFRNISELIPKSKFAYSAIEEEYMYNSDSCEIIKRNLIICKLKEIISDTQNRLKYLSE